MGAHPRGAQTHGFAQHAGRPRRDAFLRKLSFRRGHARDRRAEVGAGLAAVENAGLIEMDVGFDEPRRRQPPAETVALRRGRQVRLHGDNRSPGNADIDRIAPAGDPYIMKRQIERAHQPITFGSQVARGGQ